MRNMLEEERRVEPNLTMEQMPTGPEVRENYWCYALGYLNRDMRAGEKIFIRPNEIMMLYKILKHAIER